MLWVFITVAAIGLFWYGYRHPYRRRWLLPRPTMPQVAASAVDRQHRHLLAGGLVGESAVAATAARFEELLRAGRAADLERELQPGVAFAVQVRALAALGTPEAGRVLERQLERDLTRDPVEQSWYWADVAAGLRHLNHLAALPAVLRCADGAAGLPAGIVLATEAVSFPNFPTTLNDLSSPVGRAALRALTTVSRGCRDGAIPPAFLIRAGIGDLLATVSETAHPLPDPWLVAALIETERLTRRFAHWGRFLDEDLRAIVDRQHRRLLASEPRRTDFLHAASVQLLARFPIAPDAEQTAILRCAFELRLDVTKLFPHLPDRRAMWWAEAVRCLTWSNSPSAGPILASQTERWLRSHRGRPRVVALLGALRGHACAPAEHALLTATGSADGEVRTAAASALGWWSPFDPESVMRTLRVLRTDLDEKTRHAAVAALARLGERAALGEVKLGLSSEEPGIRRATIARIAAEELSWLWPDVQELAEQSGTETGVAASEAAERFRENALGLFR